MASFDMLRKETAHPEVVRDQPEAVRQNFEIEAGGRKFEFAEFQPKEPSNVTLLHFPAFETDGEKNAEGIHYSMDQRYKTLALKGYGGDYSKPALVEALEKAVLKAGGGHVVLHGCSLGTSVVYDLISNPADRSFLERCHVAGAILETPLIDKAHFSETFRSARDSSILSRVAELLNVRAEQSNTPKREPPVLNREMALEVLREKTNGKLISVPVHVVLAKGDALVDNAKVMATLREQVPILSSTTVTSSPGHLGHRVADYGAMWRNEAPIINVFASGHERQ